MKSICLFMITGLLLFSIFFFKKTNSPPFENVVRKNANQNAFEFYENYIDVPCEVTRFVKFVNENKDKEMNLINTSNGIALLADALVARIDKRDIEDRDIILKSKNLKTYAMAIGTENNYIKNGNKIKKSFLLTTMLMERMQPKYFPGLEDQILKVKKEAENYHADELIMLQKFVIVNFFVSSGNVLQSMARNS